MNLLRDTVAKLRKCGILRQRLQAGAQFPDGFAAVRGGLIDVSDLAQRAAKIIDIEIFRHFPGAEADAMLVGELVVKKVSDRADLALKMQSRAQLARPGKSATVSEFRKFQRHDRKTRDILAH